MSQPVGITGEHSGVVALRAVAVLGVVLFHFFPGLVPGGFLGVDVFFVISGFLISRRIYVEAYTGTFSFAAFYARRARRIVPALVATSVLTIIAAYFVLLPAQFATMAKSLMASALFGANIYFFATTGYFAAPAGDTPLLQLWSLGVEEQFYLLFPILAIALASIRLRLLGIVLAVLALTSVVAAQVMLQISPAAAFYLLPFRAFELLIGALLALRTKDPQARRFPNWIVGIGFVAILTSMFLLSGSDPMPGLLSLPVCLGAGLVIWAGEHLPRDDCITGTVVTFFADVSYSLYLWHWPVAVFGRMVFQANEIVLGCVGLAFSTGLAALSYRFVEQPFRKRYLSMKPRWIFGASAASLGTISIVSAMIWSASGWPGRMDDRINHLASFASYDSFPVFRTGDCFMRPEQTFDQINDQCIPKTHPSLIIWGSSYVAEYTQGIISIAREYGYEVGQLTASACVALPDIDVPARPNCRAFKERAIATILTRKPDIVVLDALYGGEGEIQRLRTTINLLSQSGSKVVVIGPPMSFKQSVPQILVARLRAGNASLRPDDSDSGELQSRDDTLARGLVGTKAFYISFFRDLCGGGNCLIADKDGEPYFFDTVHFTLAGTLHYGSEVGRLIFQHFSRISRTGQSLESDTR
jgi:peptidoglycan/LPS O-acetylase OafA/YrhL